MKKSPPFLENTKRPAEGARTLTKSRRHLFSRMAPQQPRKPSRKSIAPMASMMYAPVKSRGLAATISRKPVGSTMTQIPTPSRHTPPSCHGTTRRERGRRVNISNCCGKTGFSSIFWSEVSWRICVSLWHMLSAEQVIVDMVLLLSLAHWMKHLQ